MQLHCPDWHSDRTSALPLPNTRLAVPLLALGILAQIPLRLDAADDPLPQPYLVKDIDDHTNSDLHWLAAVGTDVYFNTSTPCQLWKSDGTAEGTRPVSDHGGVSELAASVNGRLLFQPFPANELWTSDGTPEGTFRLKDFPARLVFRPSPIIDDQILFVADDGEHGYELWTSDGTPERTRLLVDIRLGQGSSKRDNLEFFVEIGGRVLFLADDGEHGRELWTTDATPEGTALVRDIFPGRTGSVCPRDCPAGDKWVEGPGKLFFLADDGEHGLEIWTSDGTAEGTRLYLDFVPGVESFFIYRLTAAAGRLFFNGPGGVWTTDGTPDGTIEFRELLGLPDGASVFYPGELDGKLILWASLLERGDVLLISDGTPATTAVLKEGVRSSGGYWLDTGWGKLLFQSDDGEYWMTDGTETGTSPLRDLLGLPLEFPPFGFSPLFFAGSLLYLWAADGSRGFEPWVTDGSPAGTRLLRDINTSTTPGSSPDGLTPIGDQLFFRTTSEGKYVQWISKGTAESTQRLDQVLQNAAAEWVGPDEAAMWASFAIPSLPVLLGDKLLFTIQDPGLGIGKELWVSDTELKHMAPVADINPGPGASRPERLIVAGQRVFFVAIGGDEGMFELWATDGTEGNTIRVGAPGVGIMAAVGEVLFFTVWMVGNESLWTSDGTPEGTRLVAEGLPSGIWGLREVNGRLFFYVNGDPGETWTSDGTRAGTLRLRELLGQSENWRLARTIAGGSGRYFFPADDGAHGTELWTSDGTKEGTYMVKDIRSGPEGSGAGYGGFLALHDGRLFFRADDGEHGLVLWVSDGTSDGTRILKDVHSGPAGIGLEESAMIGGHLFFAAADGEHGFELWTSDGTPEGTRMVQEVLPGPGLVPPCPPAVDCGWPTGSILAGTRDTLFFTADDGVHGYELWALRVAGSPPPSPFRRADVNADRAVDLSDAITALGHLFLGQPGTLGCTKAADANDSGTLDLSDAVYTLGYLFLGTAEPPEPFASCGADPTDDDLACGAAESCP